MLFDSFMIKFLTFLFIFNSAAYAQNHSVDLTHPFYLLESGQFTLDLKGGLFMEEFEYEKAKVVQDLFEYKHEFYKLGTIVGLPQNRQFGIEFSFNANGDLDKKYAPALNLQRQDIPYKGFHAYDFFIQQHFEVENSKNKLAFELRTKGSPLKGKETNNTYSSKDFSFSLLYSHLHSDDWRLYGTVHTGIIGKKKVYKYDGEIEVTSPYSLFGSLIGIQRLMGKFWLDLNGIFYLTTDYNSVSPSYTRLTDKGFIIGGKLTAGHYLTPNSIITLTHQRQGANFNVITEDTSQETEFEIETQISQLGVTWLF